MKTGTIEALTNASARTKNRARKHTLKMIREVNLKNSGDSIRDHILFECDDKDCRWVGWLPKYELDWEDDVDD